MDYRLSSCEWARWLPLHRLGPTLRDRAPHVAAAELPPVLHRGINFFFKA